MNKINLPDFITFKNFNNDTLDLIAKKELEVNELDSILSYKMFIGIFVLYPDLKSLRVVSNYDFDDENGTLIVSNVYSSFFDGIVVRNSGSMLPLITNILGNSNPRRISDICDFVVSRDTESYNKLKAVFDIKSLSDEDIDKIVGGDFLSFKNDVFATMNMINKLHNQTLVIKILTLFKENNNLKKINFEFDVNIVGDNNVCKKVLFDDTMVDNKDIDGEIKEILVDRSSYTPLLFDYITVGINRNNFSDIKNLIKYVMPDVNSSNSFSSVLEKEMLEEDISPSVIKGKFKKI